MRDAVAGAREYSKTFFSSNRRATVWAETEEQEGPPLIVVFVLIDVLSRIYIIVTRAFRHIIILYCKSTGAIANTILAILDLYGLGFYYCNYVAIVAWPAAPMKAYRIG